MINVTECPRDAMQGISKFIPTPLKTDYLNQLLKVGFDTLDFGSFVSPKAVPQLQDTADVLENLDLSNTKTKLLAIVANLRGAEEAVQYNKISYLGYPLSISETFQMRNTRKSIAESLELTAQLQKLCAGNGKELVIYLSMGFGNPYDDPYSPEILADFSERMDNLGVRQIRLADTVGNAGEQEIHNAFHDLIPKFSRLRFGAHFHSTPDQARVKIEAAYQAGCRTFDVAMAGFGGCPFAEDELTGNIGTETLVDWAEQKNIKLRIDKDELLTASRQAHIVFNGIMP